MVGGPELWAFAHENPAFCQKEIDWVNDAGNIARNDHVVFGIWISNAMEIDLTGQRTVESPLSLGAIAAPGSYLAGQCPAKSRSLCGCLYWTTAFCRILRRRV